MVWLICIQLLTKPSLLNNYKILMQVVFFIIQKLLPSELTKSVSISEFITEIQVFVEPSLMNKIYSMY